MNFTSYSKAGVATLPCKNVIFEKNARKRARERHGQCGLRRRNDGSQQTHRSVSLLMSVESNSGAADAEATVTWSDAEVAARLNPLPDCFCVPEPRLVRLRT